MNAPQPSGNTGPRAGGSQLDAVLITGSGSGIGSATALWLEQRGYLVFAGVRQQAHGETLRERAADRQRIVPVQLDVTDSNAIDQAVEFIGGELSTRDGRLAGLVNNAADENLGPVELLPLSVFRQEMEVGYFGMVAVTKAFLPLLRESRGRIVNLSSINGRCTFKYHATTCATKYAVEAFSDALRMELQTWGMHVAMVEPGPTDTPLMRQKTVAEFSEKLAALPESERQRYFPDLPATVRAVEQFVDGIAAPPRGRWDKLRRLISGQGWLHPPTDVARVIHHALEHRRPKTRYLVGSQARLIYLARLLLGDRTFDRWLGQQVFDF